MGYTKASVIVRHPVLSQDTAASNAMIVLVFRCFSKCATKKPGKILQPVLPVMIATEMKSVLVARENISKCNDLWSQSRCS
jgi:hypothetical protein